jgi:hypothetical protein
MIHQLLLIHPEVIGFKILLYAGISFVILVNNFTPYNLVLWGILHDIFRYLVTMFRISNFLLKRQSAENLNISLYTLIYNFCKKEDFSETIRENTINRIKFISFYVPIHRKPLNDEELGFYLAGFIEGDGYFGDNRIEIVFHEKDAPLAYYIKKNIH